MNEDISGKQIYNILSQNYCQNYGQQTTTLRPILNQLLAKDLSVYLSPLKHPAEGAYTKSPSPRQHVTIQTYERTCLNYIPNKKDIKVLKAICSQTVTVDSVF